MEENIPEGFTVYFVPIAHRKKIPTTNNVERVNREIKRRTKVIGVFPNENSCLRLVSAILVDISEKWETGKIFLNVTDGLHSVVAVVVAVEMWAKVKLCPHFHS